VSKENKMNVINKDSLSSGIFDLIRFVAALSVVFGHAVSRFFGPFESNPDTQYPEIFFRLVFSGYGSHAVTIFFVLSGYFIGISVLKSIKKNHFAWRSYLARRAIRLWVVLLPALILTYILDTIGLNFFSSDPMYSNGNIIGSINQESINLSDFLGNALFLQTILVTPFGTNGALWSLANEFWYYILFPIGIFSLFQSRTVVDRIFFIVLFITISMFIGREIFLLFSIWLLGVALIFLPRISSKNIKIFTCLAFLSFIISLLVFRILPVFNFEIIPRLVVGTLFLFLMLTIISFKHRPGKNHQFLIISKRLGAFSYSLYAIHTPLLGLLRAYFIEDFLFMSFNIKNIALFFLAIFITILLAYAASLITEKYTNKIYLFFRV
jgi:peptidoglycan/LPS O-acetylase OafA/YrhL